MPIRSPHRIRTIRRVTLLPGVEVQVTDTTGEWFSGEIVPPADDSVALSPGPTRDREPHLARWADSTLGPGEVAPTRGSERIESASVTYELLGEPRSLYTGRHTAGVEVPVMPLDELYPEFADLQEQDGTAVATLIRCALWADATSRSGEGMYYTYTGEAPIEYAPMLSVKNRQLVVNNIGFRIIDPFVFFEVARVQFTLRGPR